MWAGRDMGVNLAKTALWEVKVVLELDKTLKLRISWTLLLLLLSSLSQLAAQIH